MSDAAFHGPKDYLDLAKSPTATPTDLSRLATSPYSFVRLAVAKHSSTPVDALDGLVPPSLAAWSDQEIALALATRSDATSNVLTAIARLVPSILHDRDAQPGFAAGIALFEHTETPDDVLLELLSNPETTTEFRKVAARQTSHRVVFDHLRDDRSERVRRAAERRAGEFDSTGSTAEPPRTSARDGATVAIVAAAVRRAWNDGCPVAGGNPDELASYALRRIRSIDRRRHPGDPVPAVLTDDLAKGLRDHLEHDPKLVGPLMKDYRYLATKIIEALGPKSST